MLIVRLPSSKGRTLTYSAQLRKYGDLGTLTIQALGGYVVKRREVGVKHDLLAADDENLPGYARSVEEPRRFVLLCDASVLHIRNNGPDGWRVDSAILSNAQPSAKSSTPNGFADYKKQVIDQFLRVTRVSVEAQATVEAMTIAIR